MVWNASSLLGCGVCAAAGNASASSGRGGERHAQDERPGIRFAPRGAARRDVSIRPRTCQAHSPAQLRGTPAKWWQTTQKGGRRSNRTAESRGLASVEAAAGRNRQCAVETGWAVCGSRRRCPVRSERSARDADLRAARCESRPCAGADAAARPVAGVSSSSSSARSGRDGVSLRGAGPRTEDPRQGTTVRRDRHARRSRRGLPSRRSPSVGGRRCLRAARGRHIRRARARCRVRLNPSSSAAFDETSISRSP